MRVKRVAAFCFGQAFRDSKKTASRLSPGSRSLLIDSVCYALEITSSLLIWLHGPSPSLPHGKV